jgi:hypothetical protein
LLSAAFSGGPEYVSRPNGQNCPPHKSDQFSSCVDGERHEFDQVGIGNGIRVRDRQRLAFFQKTLS